MSRKRLKRIGGVLAALVLLVVAGGLGFSSYATPTIRTSIEAPIFTIGDANYAVAMSEGRKVVKFGPLPLGIYPGGMAFKDRDSADRHLDTMGKRSDGWKVYRLSGEFLQDTYDSGGQSYINKSLLVIESGPQEDRPAN